MPRPMNTYDTDADAFQRLQGHGAAASGRDGHHVRSVVDLLAAGGADAALELVPRAAGARCPAGADVFPCVTAGVDMVPSVTATGARCRQPIGACCSRDVAAGEEHIRIPAVRFLSKSLPGCSYCGESLQTDEEEQRRRRAAANPDDFCCRICFRCLLKVPCSKFLP